jgi:hypothetical protein
MFCNEPVYKPDARNKIKAIEMIKIPSVVVMCVLFHQKYYIESTYPTIFVKSLRSVLETSG